MEEGGRGTGRRGQVARRQLQPRPLPFCRDVTGRRLSNRRQIDRLSVNDPPFVCFIFSFLLICNIITFLFLFLFLALISILFVRVAVSFFLFFFSFLSLWLENWEKIFFFVVVEKESRRRSTLFCFAL